MSTGPAGPYGVDDRVSGEPPIPAATVIPLRDGLQGLEVLMLRRSSRGTFGGMWVFPGGQVDPGDWPEVHDPEDEMPAARAAAVREAREEAALDIDPSTLVTLSFWLPPAGAVRRYATWFFLAPFRGLDQIVVDQVEIEEHQWLAPGDAIRLRQERRIELAPPTFTTLSWLATQPDTETALRSAASATPDRFESRIVVAAGVTICLWAGDAGYEDGDPDRIGPRRRLHLDPDGWRLEFAP